MKNRISEFRNFNVNPRRPGFALVVALTAIVLITVIVLAFFSKALLNRQISFTSTNQIKSDMLARTALDIVVGEVRQEVIDYSKASTNGIYQPLSSTNIVPIKTGVSGADTTTGAFTIAKVAAADTKIDPGTNGKTFGSTAALDAQSRNGRTLSQWFVTGPKLGSAALPSWSYLSRSGTIVTNLSSGASSPANTNFVVGRFSYTVYNIGGLLDANVAGYPTGIAGTNYGSKSSVAYADLTALGLTSAQITNLVSWRNAATGTSPDLFNSWATGISTTNTPTSKQAAAAANSGYLETTYGDNVFFSRRDLLRYLAANDIPNAASYLTHFSRAVTAPDWAPSNVTGSSINYGDDANKTSSVNRFVPAALAFDGVITDYADDGTPSTRGVSNSESLVQKKFSLAKLAWLGHNGPNAAAFASSLSSSDRELAIKTSFGLTWNSTKKRWDYDHGANGILTLDEVRDLKRAPDFFELLKAGILEGSVGQSPGVVAQDINWEPPSPRTLASMTAAEKRQYWEGPIGSHYDIYSADKDRHILQIGANIIDQADNDNFPTAVYLELYNQPSFSVSENALNNTVFGLENLPMLARLRNWARVNGDTPPEPPSGQEATWNYPVLPMGVWLQPELWNPNDSSTAADSTNPLTDPNYPTPTALRLITLGKAYVWNIRVDKDMNNVLDSSYQTNPLINFPADAKFGSDPIDFGHDVDNPSVAGIVCFKNPKPSSTQPRAFFDEPIGLTGNGDSTAQYDYYDTTSASGPDNHHPLNANWLFSQSAGRRYLGVFLGSVPHDGNENGFDVRSIPDPQLSFVLQYFDGTDWRSYAVFNRLESLYDDGGTSNSRWGQSGYASSNGHVDPRTDRLSGSSGLNSAGNIVAWHNGSVRMGPGKKLPSSGNGATESVGRNPIFQGWPRPGTTFRHGSSDNLGLLAGDAATLGGGTGSFLFDDWMRNVTDTGWNGAAVNQPRFWYKDPDGVTRPADGWRGIGWQVSDSASDTGDGMPSYHGDDTRVTASKTRRRSVILNRPFRSVGELSYVYRDLPYKTLDLWSDSSADSGLLDLFSVSDEPIVTAGKINPNSAPPLVLEAILSKTLKHNGETASISVAEAQVLANQLSQTLATTPLSSRGNMAALNTTIQTAFSSTTLPATNQTANKANKAYAESPIRALASASNTRTWNLMVDVVAQSGVFPANSTSLANSFIVQGERRYWLHLAIDRLTGKIVDSQLEQVYE